MESGKDDVMADGTLESLLRNDTTQISFAFTDFPCSYKVSSHVFSKLCQTIFTELGFLSAVLVGHERLGDLPS